MTEEVKVVMIDVVDAMCPNLTDPPTTPTVNVSDAKSKTQKTQPLRKHNPSWELKFKWLLYDAIKDCVLCKDCKTANEMTLLTFLTKLKTTFIVDDFGKC